MSGKITSGIMLLVVSLGMVSCDSDQGLQQRKIDAIRIGVLPDQSSERAVSKYQGIFDRLQTETGLAVEVVFPRSYGELTDLFSRQQVDIAYFGGVTFLRAHRESGAVPLVMRDVDMNFTSYFLVRSNEEAKQVSDFRGRRLSFGSKLSTSGHLMPRHFMLQDGIVAEEFFGEVLYSGAHDMTAIWVRDGQADIGAVNSDVVDKMYLEGSLTGEQVKILETTSPYPDYVWAVQPYVHEELRIAIRNLFTGLSSSNEQDRELLTAAGATEFIPASMEDFDGLHEIATQLGVLGD